MSFIENKVTLLSGGIQGLNFQAGIFNINNHVACLNCLYPEMNQLTNSQEVGVLGVTAGLEVMVLVNIITNFLLNKDNFFEETTATMGVIITVALISILVSILIWG